MRYLFIFILISIVLSSCNPCKRLVKKCPVKDSISYVETIRDDPNYTIPDSVFWRMHFECDSNYMVVLKEFEEMNTGLETVVEVKETVRWREDNTKVKRLTIYLSAQSDSIKSLNRTIEKLRHEKRTVTKIEQVEVVRNSKFAFFTIIFFFCVIIAMCAFIYIKIRYGAISKILK